MEMLTLLPNADSVQIISAGLDDFYGIVNMMSYTYVLHVPKGPQLRLLAQPCRRRQRDELV